MLIVESILQTMDISRVGTNSEAIRIVSDQLSALTLVICSLDNIDPKLKLLAPHEVLHLGKEIICISAPV